MVNHLEHDILYLIKMTNRQKMDQVMSLENELSQLTQTLQEEFENIRDKKSSLTSNEVISKINEIQQTLQKMMDKLSQQNQSTPDEFLNAKAYKSMNIEETVASLEKIKDLTNQGKMNEALEQLKKVAEDLRDLANQLDQAKSSMESLVDKLRERNLLPPMIHTLNSAGGINFPESIGSIVRAGIGLYGGIEFEGMNLRESINWKSKIIQVKNVVAGSRIGYGGTHMMEKDGKLAILSVGYGDGFQRLLSNRGHVIFRGQRTPIIGRVSIDLTIIDISQFDNDIQCGEEVDLLGGKSEEFISAKEMADKCETISYEILCGISYRVPRVFISEENIQNKRIVGQYS